MQHLKRLPVPGLHNCRDLGGYAAEKGVTRYGVFLRSEAPCGIPEAGVEYLRQYGLTVSYDLRSPAEIQWRPSSLADRFAYEYHCLSGGAERVVKDVRKNCDELYFAGDETVGVRVIDGDVEVFCRYPVVGSDYSGWNWY